MATALARKPRRRRPPKAEKPKPVAAGAGAAAGVPRFLRRPAVSAAPALKQQAQGAAERAPAELGGVEAGLDAAGVLAAGVPAAGAPAAAARSAPGAAADAARDEEGLWQHLDVWVSRMGRSGAWAAKAARAGSVWAGVARAKAARAKAAGAKAARAKPAGAKAAGARAAGARAARAKGRAGGAPAPKARPLAAARGRAREALGTGEEARDLRPAGLTGSRAKQVFQSFSGSTATAMARGFPALGEKLAAAETQDRLDLLSGAPATEARCDGLGPQAAEEMAAATAPSLPPPGPGPRTTLEEPEPGAAREQPDPEIRPGIRPRTGLLDRFRELLRSRSSREDSAVQIETGSPSHETRHRPEHASEVEVDPGPAPEVDATGRADPERTTADLAAAGSVAAREHRKLDRHLLANRGKERIQKLRVHEAHRLELETEVAVPESPVPEDLAGYLDLDLPDDVRARTDQAVQPYLQKKLAPARSRFAETVEARRREQEEAIAEAAGRAAELGEQAGRRQDQEVARARTQVAEHQRQGLGESRKELEKFDRQASSRQQETRDRVSQEIERADLRAEEEIRKGEEKAEEERKKAVEEEEDERQEYERKKKKKKGGIFGSIASFFKKLWNKLKNLVTKIVSKLTSVVKAVIKAAQDLANKIIDAATQLVSLWIDQLAGILKVMVTALVGAVFPQLAAKINLLIDKAVAVAKEVVQQVADALKSAVAEVANVLNKAVELSSRAIQVALEYGPQILAALVKGDLLGLVKAAFMAACEIAGVPGEQLWQLLEKALHMLWEIIKHPGSFLGNLVKSIKRGFGQFASNVGEHIVTGLLSWIFGHLSSVGIEAPKSFSLGEIFKLVRQVLGFTTEYVRARAATVLGEKNVERLERVVHYFKVLFEKGPGAILEELKSWAREQAAGPIVDWIGSLKDRVLESVTTWIHEKVIKKGTETVAKLFTPGANLVETVGKIWKTLKFFYNYIREIIDLVNAIFDSMIHAAKGAIDAAANSIELSMVLSLKLVFNWLAKMLGIGDVGEKVGEIIEGLRAGVDKVVDTIVERLKGLTGQAGEWWQQRMKFRTGAGVDHELFFTGDKEDLTAMLASGEEAQVAEKIRHWRQLATAPDATSEMKGATDRLNRLEEIDGIREKTRETGGEIFTLVEALTNVFEAAAVSAAAAAAAELAVTMPTPQPNAAVVYPVESGAAGPAPAAAGAPEAVAVEPPAAEPEPAAPEAAVEAAPAVPPLPADTRGIVGALTSSTPTAFVTHMAGAGAALTAAARTEEAAAHAGASEFRAHLPGPAETPPARELEAPSLETGLEAGVTGPEAEAPVLPREEAVPVVPALPGETLTGSQEPASVATAEQYSDALDQIPATSDANIDPGPPPAVELSGASDPERSTAQAADAEAKMAACRTEFSAAIDQGPGAEQVQGVEVDETCEVAAATVETIAEAPLPDEALEYAAQPVAPEVRAQADAILQPQFQEHLAGADGELRGAVETRDEERAAAVEAAQTRIDTAGVEAREDQDLQLGKARDDIRTEQSDVKAEQDLELEKTRGQSQSKYEGAWKDVEQRRKTDQAKIAQKYNKASRDAAKEKDVAERDARDEKQKAEDKKKDESWWSRAVSAIRNFLGKIAKAVAVIFNVLAVAVAKILNEVKAAATDIINDAVKFATGVLDRLGRTLQGLVDTLIGSIFPDLARRINGFIERTVTSAKAAVVTLGEKLKSAVNTAVDSLNAGIQATLKVFKTAATTGLKVAAAAVTGDFAGGARALLEGALELAGISPEEFYGFVGRPIETIVGIVRAPGDFLLTLLAAVNTGFGQFSANFLEHLKTGFFEWLAGPIGEMGISLPKTWDLKGIFGLVMDVLGINRAGVRQVVTRVLGERAGGVFDHVMEYIDALMAGGMQGLWEKLESDLRGLWEMVVGGIKGWLVTKIVREAVITIAAMFTGVGALAKVVPIVWNVYNFLRENLARISGVIQAIASGIAQIVQRAFKPVANLVEQQLAGLIPIAISLLANLLQLGGLTTFVRQKIEAARDFIFGLMKKLILKAKGLAKDLLKKGKAVAKKGKAAAKKGIEKLADWWKLKSKFKAKDGRNHSLFLEQSKGKRADLGSFKLMIASDTPVTVEQYLDTMAKTPSVMADRTMKAAVKKGRRLLSDRWRVIIHGKAKDKRKLHDLRVVLDQIGRELAMLAGNPAPPAKAVYSMPSKKPEKVTAKLLHKANITRGSGTSAGPNTGVTGWRQAYNECLTTITDGWVQMHLINCDFGGDGIPENLVPGPGGVNKGPKQTRFDDTNKNLLNQHENVIWIHVDVSYRSGTVRDKDGKNVELDQYARRLELASGMHVPDGTDWNKESPAKVKAKITVPPPPFGTVAKKEKVKLNESTGTQMRRSKVAIFEEVNTPYAESLISFIKKERRFGSYEDLQKKLTVSARRAQSKIPQADVIYIVSALRKASNVTIG